MGAHVLRLIDARIGASAERSAQVSGPAMIYCAEGSAMIGDAGLARNEALYGTGPLHVAAGPGGARLLRFELVSGEVHGDGGSAPNLVLARHLTLDDPGGYLMRCDRVDFPLGGIAYLHTHQGPGIRCLVAGGIRVETGGEATDLVPFEAWFESGPEPVLARASNESETAFIRVMILPASLLGQSSIRYVNAEDQDKPKRQRYTIFQDKLITI